MRRFFRLLGKVKRVSQLVKEIKQAYAATDDFIKSAKEQLSKDPKFAKMCREVADVPKAFRELEGLLK